MSMIYTEKSKIESARSKQAPRAGAGNLRQKGWYTMCKKRNVYTLSELTLALTALFNAMNRDFFGGELEKVVVTTKEGSKEHAYGWITTAKEWQQGKEVRHEINISCDYLSRPVDQIAATMLHEMVHLYCMQNDIKDTSRKGYYHNERFRDAAAAHHLITEQADKIGWSVSRLDDHAREWLKDNSTFASIRIMKTAPPPKEQREKKPSSTRKYICPFCGMSVRATKEVNIICGDCNEKLELSA